MYRRFPEWDFLNADCHGSRSSYLNSSVSRGFGQITFWYINPGAGNLGSYLSYLSYLSIREILFTYIEGFVRLSRLEWPGIETIRKGPLRAESKTDEEGNTWSPCESQGPITRLNIRYQNKAKSVAERSQFLNDHNGKVTNTGAATLRVLQR